MINCVEDLSAPAYLEPQSLGAKINFGRQLSANDSGIVDLHGSRYSSRVGLAVPNDCYRAWDSDQDGSHMMPNRGSQGLNRMNSHPPFISQRSYPIYRLPQGSVKFIQVPEYEELPNSNRNQEDMNTYTPIDEASVISTSEPDSKPGEIIFVKGKVPLGQQTSISSSKARKRENPVYQPPSTPPLHSSQDKRHTRSSICCCLRVILALCCLAALVLAVTSFLNRRLSAEFDTKYRTPSPDDGVTVIEDDPMNQQLIHNISELRKTIEAMQSKLDTLQSRINSQNASTESLRSQLTFHENQELSGLVNMSGCTHKTKTSGSSTTSAEYETDPIDLKNHLVLGVACSTTGGTEAFLLYDNQHPKVYRCICRGRRENEENRFCIIHYWTCPLLP